MGVVAPAEIRYLGRQAYEPVWRDMQAFTEQRDEQTPDELWVVEHDSVFTLGMNGKAEHVLAPGNIPLVNVDRGGQVTYHGPGQVVIYTLINLKRRKMGVRELVSLLENSVVTLLAQQGIHAYPKPDAPGVYVAEKKIAALGLRVRRGCAYHGVSFNVAMDLEPFARINPCGYAGLLPEQSQDLGIDWTWQDAAKHLSCAIQDALQNHSANPPT